MTNLLTNPPRLGGAVTRPTLAALAIALLGAVFLANADSRIQLLALGLALVAVTVISLELPIAVFGLLALLLGLASEDEIDSFTPSFTDSLYAKPVVLAIVMLLIVALLLDGGSGQRRWPGLPATVAACLSFVAIAAAARLDALSSDLYVARPIFLLTLSIVAGYLVADRFGVDLPLKLLTAAAALAIALGLYNVGAGHSLSFYDSSFVYLVGVMAIMVLFRGVEIGVARYPFLILAAIVIVFSLRRGTIIAVLIALGITGLLKGRSGFRIAIALGLGTIAAAEIASPGLVFDNLDRLVGYFVGASGSDFSVNYRKYETANAWLNIKAHWLGGIGPSTDWTLYRTFDGRFKPYGLDYLHNSFLWVWLRFSLVGLVAYVAFLLVSAFSLIRRSAPIESVVIGAAMAGLAFALATASFLTTTVRWPLLVGLLVGIALCARRDAADGSPST